MRISLPIRYNYRCKRLRKGDGYLNFDLTEEQQMIKKMIREFADEEVAPGAIDRDRTKDFPVEIFKKLSEMGMMGLPFSEEYGGGGAIRLVLQLLRKN